MSVAITTEGFVSPAGDNIIYRMRGYDPVLMQIVYWNSNVVDGTASSYTGPGTPTDIVVAAITGTPP